MSISLFLSEVLYGWMDHLQLLIITVFFRARKKGSEKHRPDRHALFQAQIASQFAFHIWPKVSPLEVTVVKKLLLEPPP